ncbi:putative RNA pseudouridine synthase YlyB [Alicyclobacillus contaminans]|uniref:RluA family pseudouridine synthase n=1 Tax=Alicyclobacillus contaminans TaxID=392016 RepID=UPI0004011F51|nr:RluA family pseudouridine synthase [Alicyclobacillus contaminans]GMA49139.1 putative RNA pseudouridine synthase YlyB [Alicyclobacillus contaminans]
MTWISETFTVEPGDAGQRLDRWLTDALADSEYEVSRSQLQQWLAGGYIEGPRRKLKASDPVAPGETYVVTVPDPEPVTIMPDPVPFDVVHLDDDVVVVNKPRGIVVHPAAGHLRGTVVNGLYEQNISLSSLGGSMRPGVVHRIDKDTSGLIMFARTDLAYHGLAEQLKEHSVHRIYRAIIHGVLEHDEGMIDAPIGRDPRHRQRMAVHESGKPAITHFHVLERFADYTYVELRLETGRTHQIRVHMAYIGHPLAGDPVYGRRRTLDIEGQALHAMALGFTHPRSGQRLEFSAEVPDDMQRLLTMLRTDLEPVE